MKIGMIWSTGSLTSSQKGEYHVDCSLFAFEKESITMLMVIFEKHRPYYRRGGNFVHEVVKA